MEHLHKIRFESGNEYELTDKQFKEWQAKGRAIQKKGIDKYMASIPNPSDCYFGYDWDSYIDNYNAFIDTFNKAIKGYLNDESNLFNQI